MWFMPCVSTSKVPKPRPKALLVVTCVSLCVQVLLHQQLSSAAPRNMQHHSRQSHVYNTHRCACAASCSQPYAYGAESALLTNPNSRPGAAEPCWPCCRQHQTAVKLLPEGDRAVAIQCPVQLAQTVCHHWPCPDHLACTLQVVCTRVLPPPPLPPPLLVVCCWDVCAHWHQTSSCLRILLCLSSWSDQVRGVGHLGSCYVRELQRGGGGRLVYAHWHETSNCPRTIFDHDRTR